MPEWVGPLCFCCEEIARIPVGVPGVYVLQAVLPGSSGYAVVYVGQSCDLARRLGEHLGERSSLPLVRAMHARFPMYFSAAPVVEVPERLRLESGLIRLLQPVCNDQTPS